MNSCFACWSFLALNGHQAKKKKKRRKRPTGSEVGSHVTAEAVKERLKETTPSHRKGHQVDLSSLLLVPHPERAVNAYYTGIKRIGQGGFGTVFTALHTLSGEMRAIKQVAKTGVREDMAFVYGELEALMTLDHPNIARMYEFFEDSSFLYIAMESCLGGDFGTLMSYSPVEVRLLFRDIVMALAYCHDLGVAHRDMKFENCLINKVAGQRRVGKVVDFGLAAIRREGQKAQWLTEVLGTRFFVAPEVVDGRVAYGVQADIWSVGVMIYLYVTKFREHPCTRNALKMSSAKLFEHIQRGHVREKPLDEYGVSGAARQLLGGLLQKHQGRRWDAARALKCDWLSPPTCLSSCASPTSASWASGSSKQLSPRTGEEVCSSKTLEALAVRLQNFSELSKFERAVLTLAAHTAVAREVDDLRSAFIELDVEGNGSLSKEEIRDALDGCSHEISDAELDRIFQVLDANGSGKVMYTEWLAATLKPSILASESAVKQIYSFFDLSRDGTISRHELMEVLGDDEQVDDILRRADSSRDGNLDEEEFRALLESIARDIERKHTF